MVMPTTAPSILIFDINRKFLLYKILNKNFAKQLREEIIKLFGVNYVNEKNQEQNKAENINNGGNLKEGEETKKKISSRDSSLLDSSIEEDNQQNSSAEDKTETDNTQKRKSSPTPSIKNKAKLTLTNDLIYEYFSPIVNSFEISKEIAYVYEYVLINRNKYTIRFCQYNNCLILLIYNLIDQQFYLNVNTTRKSSELTRQIYIDYYTNWFNKSLVSLLKFKFGICSNEKCFNLNKKNEIKNLYTKWSEYFLNDQSYFVEAIDQLVINDDIKAKCRLFLDDLVEFFYNMESILSEFEYIEKKYGKLQNNENEDEHGDMEFMHDDLIETTKSAYARNLEVEEFENFFTDPTEINQFILAYNSKLLYKYKKSSSRDRQNVSRGSSSSFSIDSSSIFMLLLEASEFLNFTTEKLIDSSRSDDCKQNQNNKNLSESGDENFESVSDSPTPKSLLEEDKAHLSQEETDEQDLKPTNENNLLSFDLKNAASFVESFKTPLSHSNYLNENFKTDVGSLRRFKIFY